MISVCDGCFHYRSLGFGSTEKACHFCLDTGKCRITICSSGKECTVRKDTKERKYMQLQHKYSFSDNRHKEFERLYNEGLSDPQIAKSVGCHTSTVYEWRKRTGRKSNYKEKIKKDQQARIERDCKAVNPAEDPCLKCRSKSVCEANKGTCNAKARWDGDNGVAQKNT